MEVQKLQKDIQLEINRAQEGQVLDVLCLGRSRTSPRLFMGRSQGFQVVNFKSAADYTGQFIRVRITGCGPYSLHGEAQ
jgi:tRNA-2-methylthio-N6-dimethylallyladenosine synthase